MVFIARMKDYSGGPWRLQADLVHSQMLSITVAIDRSWPTTMPSLPRGTVHSELWAQKNHLPQVASFWILPQQWEKWVVYAFSTIIGPTQGRVCQAHLSVSWQKTERTSKLHSLDSGPWFLVFLALWLYWYNLTSLCASSFIYKANIIMSTSEGHYEDWMT